MESSHGALYSDLFRRTIIRVEELVLRDFDRNGIGQQGSCSSIMSMVTFEVVHVPIAHRFLRILLQSFGFYCTKVPSDIFETIQALRDFEKTSSAFVPLLKNFM